MSLKLMSAVIPNSASLQKKTQESEKIIKQLLECVQECQKRYGSKTELATEFDNCVAGICITLEIVLSHGLRLKPQDNNQASTLKQVSGIVASSLNINSDKASFWPFICKHLTKHERERYNVLKHIWTDIGRGRAWIRSSLNEHSLERYFHILLGNQELLENHYEDWALLRDDEKTSMLPNMAAGLGSILFAISIDKPELNSGLAPRSDTVKIKQEPIIRAPLPDQTSKRLRHKKKRKVARQIINFDEDDNMLSTSVPSSSSSISSESSTEVSLPKTLNKSSLIKIMEENKPNEEVPLNKTQKPTQSDELKTVKRQLSIETSGSRDKFINELPNTLMPITQSEIGELKPISVEVNTNFESPNPGDDSLEVPTDVSAVLTAVENRNKEEVKKLQEKLDILSKDNERLKQQVNKYISAIKLLKHENEDDDNDESHVLKDLNLDSMPDYKHEAKIFEKKLVQVAEMHAELMDFNVSLQQSLHQKDALIERMKIELELLRGPMPTDELDAEIGCVNIWIPSAFLTGSGSSSHHVYQIYLRAGNDEWNIYRRYAQFYALHTDLKKLDPVVATFDFPPKKSIGKKDATLVEARRKRLQTYLRRVLNHWPELSQCNSRFLLEQQLTFFKDVKDKQASKTESRRTATSSDNHYTGL